MARVHLVLLHGEILDSELWGAAFLKALEPHHVVRIDLLAHGRYERRSLPGSLDEVVEAAHARFLTDVTPKPEDVVVLVGHSLGAWVATRWSELYEGVDAVCAISSVAGVDLHQLEKYAGLSRAIEQRAGLSPEVARLLVREQWMPGVDPDVQERFIRHLTTLRATPMLDTLRLLVSAEPVDPANLFVPYHAVRGAHDTYAVETPGERVVGRTHFPHLEDPTAVGAVVHTTVHHAIVKRAVERTWLHADPEWMDAFRAEGWQRVDPWLGITDRSTYSAARTELRPVDTVVVDSVAGDGETLQCCIHLRSGDDAWTVFLLQTWHDGQVHRTAASYPHSLLERS